MHASMAFNGGEGRGGGTEIEAFRPLWGGEALNHAKKGEGGEELAFVITGRGPSRK